MAVSNWHQNFFLQWKLCQKNSSRQRFFILEMPRQNDKWQGYSSEKTPNTFTEFVIIERQNETKRSAVDTIFAKVSTDNFFCDELLNNGLNRRIIFVRNRPCFYSISADETQDYKFVCM